MNALKAYRGGGGMASLIPRHLTEMSGVARGNSPLGLPIEDCCRDYCNIVLLSTCWISKYGICFRFSRDTHIFVVCSKLTTCPSHLILLDSITIKVFDDEYNLGRS